MSTDTPLMQQYKKIKEEYQNEILMFRLGDFYEMFLRCKNSFKRIRINSYKEK